MTVSQSPGTQELTLSFTSLRPFALLHLRRIQRPIHTIKRHSKLKMPAVPPGSKVLVSGANGFIAVWVVRDLLERGYSVRGTVRSESKATHIRKLFESYGEKFEVAIVPDITQVQSYLTSSCRTLLTSWLVGWRLRHCCERSGCH